MVSHTGRDHAARFPTIADAIRRLPGSSLVLDGEVARFDAGACAFLIAALAAVLGVKSRAPELPAVYAWLPVSLVVVRMQRHGYDFSLTQDRNGWRATFLHRNHLLYPWVGQVLH